MQEISYIKLSELTRKIEQVIRNNFSDFYWVVAEISGHKFYANSDRHYFDLVEKIEGSNVEAAKVKGKSWVEGSANIKLFEHATGQIFENGLQVLIKVKVEYHSIFGLSVTLIDIDQSFTLGNLEKQRRQTLERLVNENPEVISFNGEEYITANKLLPLNCVIQEIALIGSHNSEGYFDFIHTLEENKFGYRFRIDNYFSAVQGGEAERELVNTLIAVYSSKKKYDCVVIIRGGGAKTDFLVFDTYSLARAVARFPVPVFTGIGHHKDVSIVDMMAHTSTKTPTKTAESIISHNHTFEEKILHLQKSVIIKTQQLLGSSYREINQLNSAIINLSRSLLSEEKDSLQIQKQNILQKSNAILTEAGNSLTKISHELSSRPRSLLSKKKSEINFIASGIRSFSTKLVSVQKSNLNHYSAMVRLMSPENILKKGFAIISVDDKITHDAEKIEEGKEIRVILSGADIRARVISKKKRNEEGTDL